MLHLTKIQIASIAVASVLASYVAAGSLAPKNLSEDSNITIEQALLEFQYADAAAVDYFLKVEGIEGESTAEGHRGEIDILSFQYGVTQQRSPVPGGDPSGPPVFSDIFITKKLDKSSPKLFQACTRGEHLPAVQLILERAMAAGEKPVKYLEIKLTNAMVTSYQTSGQTGDIPTEQISLNFTKIEYKYTQTDKKGKVVDTVEASWDLERNE